MKKKYTKEVQYSYLIDRVEKFGYETLGLMSSAVWERDPKRMAFVLARYKFVSKIFSGMNEVLEIGCGDGWASRIVNDTVVNLTLSDFDPIFTQEAKSRISTKWPYEVILANFVEEHVAKLYDGVYLLDVFEHINPINENKFISNIKKSMKDDALLLIGIPSLYSQELIPVEKRDPGHVNCKSGNELMKFMSEHFKRVIIFSMNDEVVHTGNTSLAHYLFALCTHKK